MIVDAQWRVMNLASGSDAARTAEPAAIAWETQSKSGSGPGEILRGRFGDRLGVALVRSEGGYLVYHIPAEPSEAVVAAIDRLWIVGAITFGWIIALSVTMLYLQIGRHHDKLDEVRSILDARVLQRSQALIRTRDAVIFAISRLADYRDHETGNHLERISSYSTVLASEMAHHPKFAARVTPSFVRLIGVSSVLHDIGKIGIEDSILRKPGPLTSPQRQRMQQHVLSAEECLREIQQRMGHSSLLDMGRLIAVAHHEKWDGTGYPYGLAGEQIPLEARIVAVADVYDALSTRRVYKEALPHEECVTLIREEGGRHFDPDIIEVWLTIESKFLEISRRYADREGVAPQEAVTPSHGGPLDELEGLCRGEPPTGHAWAGGEAIRS
jgi:hypothetical protein